MVATWQCTSPSACSFSAVVGSPLLLHLELWPRSLPPSSPSSPHTARTTVIIYRPCATSTFWLLSLGWLLPAAVNLATCSLSTLRCATKQLLPTRRSRSLSKLQFCFLLFTSSPPWLWPIPATGRPGSSLVRVKTGPPCASFYLEVDTCESRGRREVEDSLNLLASPPGAWVKPIRRS